MSYYTRVKTFLENTLAKGSDVRTELDSIASSITQLQTDLLNAIAAASITVDAKVNYSATGAPAVGDDADDGYSAGSRWVDVTNDKVYVCVDASVGAAVWREYAPATATSGEMVAGSVTAIRAMSPSLVAAAISGQTVNPLPVPAIVFWPGRNADIPANWYAMDGRTMGNALSGADIASDDLEATHDVLKYMDPNAGTEVWGTNTVVIPDWRGRSPMGMDNMGTSAGAANTTTNANADTIGGTFGAEFHTLTTGEMPTHNHSVTGGSHVHTYRQRTETNAASGAGTGGIDDGGGYSNLNTEGTGSHSHTVGNAGGGGAHNNLQPCVAVIPIIYLGA